MNDSFWMDVTMNERKVFENFWDDPDNSAHISELLDLFRRKRWEREMKQDRLHSQTDSACTAAPPVTSGEPNETRSVKQA